MQEVKLKTAQREVQGKAVKGLRQSGQVPGIVYGQGKDAMVVQADARSLEKAFQQAGTSKLITLEIEGVPPTNVLFHEVQHDPLSQRILHFDLYKVKMDEKIKTEVPIYLVGDAPAE
ncbi:50S ribosomal protein L25, partial [Candidatus Microgenomates bacterium]|nr:50S ribosomal protein L25 [Candidatus Microgenomates bacterium]